MSYASAGNENGPELIVFQGRVIKRDHDLRDKSGGDLVYRLVKYKVERLCEGDYTGSQIVVDHLMMSGDELTGLKVGDVVCLTVEKQKKISPRWNVRGIREPSEVVNMFYRAQNLTRASCKCPRRK
jgi:hypothetical protein